MAKPTKNPLTNAVKTFFYGSEEENQQAQSVPQQGNVPVGQANTVTNFQAQQSVTMPSSETGASGLVDNNMIDMVWNAIQSKQSEGPDYNELRAIAKGLVGIVPDETMRLQGAFNILKGKYPNLTKQDLITSIEACLAVVEEQETVGLAQCEQKRIEKVDSKRNEAHKYEAEAAEILKLIEEKKKQYNEVLDTARQLSTEASNMESEINQQKQVFENSIQAVSNQLNLDKMKVSNLSV